MTPRPRRSRRELEREVERLDGDRGRDRAEDWRAYITGAITPEEWSARHGAEVDR